MNESSLPTRSELLALLRSSDEQTLQILDEFLRPSAHRPPGLTDDRAANPGATDTTDTTDTDLNALSPLGPDSPPDPDLDLDLDPFAPWLPIPGPQQQALASPADVLLYGGAAGGGKSDLALGAALTRHRRSIIFRREATQTVALVERLSEILGHRNGFNSQSGIWRVNSEQVIEFGSCPNPGDEMRYQGRPHDLIVFDEAAHFLERQVRFLMTWNRTTHPKQRARAIMTTNPPTPDNSRKDADGLWLISYFAPWLDPEHPNPARPGELRWYIFDPEQRREVEITTPLEVELAALRLPVYFMEGGKPVYATSRTFIPAKVTDNPYLMETGYMAQLQALPEELRAAMLEGDFAASLADKPMQVIPTPWIREAVSRTKALTPAQRSDFLSRPMTAIGVDPARGGSDNMMIARRHGLFYDALIAIPGRDVPDGPTAAARVIEVHRHEASIVIDAIGIGGSAYDVLSRSANDVVAFQGSERNATATDRSGKLHFVNHRAQSYWRFRELLDPATPGLVYLPDDPLLVAELAAPTFGVTSTGIQMVSKDQIRQQLGRSPDRADAVVMAAWGDTTVDDLYDPLPDPGYRRTQRRRIGYNTPIDYDTSWII